MNSDISEQAKAALADVAKRKARERLRQDGSDSSDAVRRRVMVLAHERGLPPTDVAPLLRKRISTASIGPFCEKYGVSYDWLLCGDLAGLQRMKQQERDTAEQRRKETAEICALYAELDPGGKQVFTAYLLQLAKKR
jgi:hypothetical protein